MQGKIMQGVSACGNDAVPSPGSAPSAGTALGSVPAHSMAWWEVGSRKLLPQPFGRRVSKSAHLKRQKNLKDIRF